MDVKNVMKDNKFLLFLILFIVLLFVLDYVFKFSGLFSNEYEGFTTTTCPPTTYDIPPPFPFNPPLNSCTTSSPLPTTTGEPFTGTCEEYKDAKKVWRKFFEDLVKKKNDPLIGGCGKCFSGSGDTDKSFCYQTDAMIDTHYKARQDSLPEKFKYSETELTRMIDIAQKKAHAVRGLCTVDCKEYLTAINDSEIAKTTNTPTSITTEDPIFKHKQNMATGGLDGILQYPVTTSSDENFRNDIANLNNDNVNHFQASNSSTSTPLEIQLVIDDKFKKTITDYLEKVKEETKNSCNAGEVVNNPNNPNYT